MELASLFKRTNIHIILLNKIKIWKLGVKPELINRHRYGLQIKAVESLCCYERKASIVALFLL